MTPPNDALRAALAEPHKHWCSALVGPCDCGHDAAVLAALAGSEPAGLREPTPGLFLAYLERFIDYKSGRPMYVTANGIRQDMPPRFHADARALRVALAATPTASPTATGPGPDIDMWREGQS